MKLIFAAGVGVTLFVWTIITVQPAKLVAQLPMLGGILPLVLVLAAVRFALQAAGWRLAMPSPARPSTGRAFAAVLAGEAVGYVAWGSLSREPVKALMVSRHTPENVSLAAAITERLAYTCTAAGLIVLSVFLLAARTDHIEWIGGSIIAFIAAIGFVLLWRRRSSSPWVERQETPRSRFGHSVRAIADHLRRQRGATLFGLGALAMAQEATNVLETYVILGWLGAAPGLEAAIMFEGLSRLLNSAGHLVPGKLGVYEMAGAGVASALRLGSVHGLTLILARRIRSLVWGSVGLTLLTLSAARRGTLRTPRPIDPGLVYYRETWASCPSSQVRSR